MDQREVWNDIAVDWREFRVKTPKDVLDFFKGKRGRVLDLGCGSGRNFFMGKDILLYGVDFSEKMIRLAKDYASEKGIKIDLRVANAWETGFEEGFFDFVLFYTVLHCIDSKEKRHKSLEEIYRILKKGGEVLISVWSRNSPRVRNKEKECYIPWGEKNKRYTYVYGLKELEKLVKRTGFKVSRSWENDNINLILKKAS